MKEEGLKCGGGQRGIVEEGVQRGITNTTVEKAKQKHTIVVAS